MPRGRGCRYRLRSSWSSAHVQSGLPPSVAPGYQIQFPRDEGSHPQFKTEWWYVTGWLEDASGAPLGFQLTFFRSRTGIDDETRRASPCARSCSVISRSAIRNAALCYITKIRARLVSAWPQWRGLLDVYIDDWQLRREGGRVIAWPPDDDLAARPEVAAESAAACFRASRASVRRGRIQFGQLLLQLASARRQRTRRHRRQDQAVHGVAWFDHEVVGRDRRRGARWGLVGSVSISTTAAR